MVLKRSRKEEKRLRHLRALAALDVEEERKGIEMVSHKRADVDKMEEGKQEANEDGKGDRSRRDYHKKKVGEHQSAYGMHGHGDWSIEDMEQGAKNVKRFRTGVVTKCADHINRYIVEFDEKVKPVTPHTSFLFLFPPLVFLTLSMYTFKRSPARSV